MALAAAGSIVALAACGGGGDDPGSGGEQGEAPAEAAFDPVPWVERGQEVQQATFQALSGELQAAMQRGGVPEALEYCNVAAYPLTDSLSAEYGVMIRRATLEPRNPDNRATESEAEAIREYARRLAQGEELSPIVHQMDGGGVAYYSPIRVQPLCLNCHGEIGAEVTAQNAELIRELYPEDQATGYDEGDLRGVWSLRFSP